MMFLRILLLFIFLSSPELLADTSGFFKLSVFRFTKEEIVRPVAGTVNMVSLPDDTVFHVQGTVDFIPGEWMPPKYYTEDEYNELRKTKKIYPVEMNLRTFPHTQKDLAQPFGTFILRFKNQKHQTLTLNFPRWYHPMDVFIALPDGTQRVLSIDKLSQEPAKNRSINLFINNTPLIEADGDFILIAHAASPLREGQPSINFSSFYIGENHLVLRMLYYNRYFGKLIMGAFFIIFVFYTFIYAFRLKDLSSLYLSLYALFCLGLSSIYETEYGISPDAILDIFTILNTFAIGFLQLFLLDKIKFRFSQKVHAIGIATALFIPFLVAILIFLKVFILVGLLFVLFFVSSILLIFTTIVIGLRHHLNGIQFFVVGTFFNMLFQIPILIGFIKADNSENGYFILLANFFMAISLALVNAKEFAVTYQTSIEQGLVLEQKNQEITFFNKNLEKLVALKTQEIRSLLDHIPQGVLSIGREGLVAKDYSAHLAKIIETEDIAQRSFKELLFAHSNLNSDLKDQAWQSVLATVGETYLNFEINQSKFPAEIPFQVRNQQKYLKATWNADLENDIVQRILVTLLDVTNEKSLEQESEQQRRELRMIEELINTQPNKVTQFFLTSLPLLQENFHIVSEMNGTLDSYAIRTLFVNAHTVKGAARTLQFKDMAQVVHEMEEYYSDILKKGVSIDSKKLLIDIQNSLDALQTYRHINHHKLGRSNDYEKVPIERDFIEKHYYLLKKMSRMDAGNMEDFVEKIKLQSDELTKVIFEQLPSVFEVYKEKAIKIARDLGKSDPIFAFDIQTVWIPPDTRTVLDNCMIHILRNSLDHGIESAADRRKSGKPDFGKITITANLERQLLHIKIEDDGRGLAISKLKEQGLKQGLLNPSSSPDEIAEIIFASGLTTAATVSMVSGRGVGMEAVRAFLAKIDAFIKVQVGKPKAEDPDYYGFHIDITLPVDV